MLAKVIFILDAILVAKSQFLECHDETGYNIEEGPLEELMFTWLGTLQYIHIKRGLPNYFRVPRVILITRQFALTTAVDAVQVPDGFALGNVVFGDYERDETECRLTAEDLARGADCETAILLMPIADVILHPEQKHFDIQKSIALLKLLAPVKSFYMVPACLPVEDIIFDKSGRIKEQDLHHIDFISDVPRDFSNEDREVYVITLLPKELCQQYENWEHNNTDLMKDTEVCSTGCGFHSGAPVVVHEHTGHWTVVALSEGGQQCPDPQLTTRPPPPPRHILLRPYVPWITSSITGKTDIGFDKDDPFGYIVPRSNGGKSKSKVPNDGWVGHWWLGGLRCYDRGQDAQNLFRFYSEIFQIYPKGDTVWEYYLEIAAAHGVKIVCVKVKMPFRLGQPRVWELDTPMINLRIPLAKFSMRYNIQIEAWGYNTTTDESSFDEPCDEPDIDFTDLKAQIPPKPTRRWGI